MAAASLVWMLASCSNGGSGSSNSVTVDGVSTDMMSVSVGNSALIGSNYSIAYTNGFGPSALGYPQVTLMLGDHVYSSYSAADFFAFFTTGSKSFAADPSTVGFTVRYKETSGSDAYSSAYGNQTGSTVNFTSFTQHPGSGWQNDYVSYTVTFDCKVYNTVNTSLSKNISGTLEGNFEAY